MVQSVSHSRNLNKTTKDMEIFKTEISVYNGVTDNIGTVQPLGDFLFSARHKAEIEALRLVGDKRERDRRKRLLSQATISGVFSPTRSKSGLVGHTGLICADIDAKENPGVTDWEELKRGLAVLPQVAYCARSVSGRGVFAIIPLAYPGEHMRQFRQLQLDFRRMGITIDSACGDVTRLRCQSFDPLPVVNEHATPYAGLYTEPPRQRAAYAASGDSTLEAVARCCDAIERSGTDITYGYPQWLRVGCSLASLGEAGREAFHTCSRQNDGYNAERADRLFSDLVRRGYTDIGIGTFFHICREHGITRK